ncbi:MAG: hypothetical protein HQL96_00245 [Magnetococcales bacterium]|nr:hypothetical protein [Magnetococcales bacterium]
MSMFRLFPIPVLLAMLALPFGAAHAANWYNSPFSADILMTNPENPKDQAKGKLFVGPDRFRSEGVYQGTKKVLIINLADRKAFTLLPDKKEYHEGMSEALMPPKPDVELMPSDPQGPCKTDTQLSCTPSGNETINGIATEKWTVKASAKEVAYQVSLWIEPKRRIVIRQQPENGPTMERKLLGVEKVNGRDTEKWEFTHSFKDKRNSYLQWIDVNLRIPVRMGEGRNSPMEISNIVEGNQDAALFQVPKDFKQVAPPAPPSPLPDEPNAKGQPPAPGQGADQKAPAKFQ